MSTDEAKRVSERLSAATFFRLLDPSVVTGPYLSVLHQMRQRTSLVIHREGAGTFLLERFLRLGVSFGFLITVSLSLPVSIGLSGPQYTSSKSGTLWCQCLLLNLRLSNSAEPRGALIL